MNQTRIGLADWRLPVSGEDAVCLAAHLGVDGIQLDLGGPGRTPWLDDVKRLHIIGKVLKASKVRPLAISANILNDIGLIAKKGTSSERQVRRIILRALNVAVKLGVRLVFLPSFRRSTIDNPFAFVRTVEVLRWSCREASTRKLLLASENVLVPKKLYNLIRLVHSPNFRVMLDSGNLSAAGLKVTDILNIAASVLAGQVHIKNSDDKSPLNIKSFSVLDVVFNLIRMNVNVEAFIIENDYRDGNIRRLYSDIRWVRGFCAERLLY